MVPSLSRTRVRSTETGIANELRAVVFGLLTQQLRRQLSWIATRFDVQAHGLEQLGVRMYRVGWIQLRLNQLAVMPSRHPLCDEALTTARASPGEELAGGGTVAPVPRGFEENAALGADVRGPRSTPLLG
jgi:hypothetical protein